MAMPVGQLNDKQGSVPEPRHSSTILTAEAREFVSDLHRRFNGTWVAHPDLVPVAGEVFERVLESRPHQKHRLREEVSVEATALLNFEVPGGKITEAGFRNNISVGLQYLERWLHGLGAVAIHNLMEDVATAEISRAQLWQWVARGARLEDGRTVTVDLYRQLRDEELAKLASRASSETFREAVRLLDGLVLGKTFTEFLTIPAYQRGIA